MQPRISQSSFYKMNSRLVKHLAEVGNVPADAGLDSKLLHLVRLRASQLNHCGFCQKMHSDEARSDGELQSRLDVLPAWKEVEFFTREERAALAWTEALTLISQHEISDDIYQAALEAFGENALIELTSVILQINSWNRIAVSFRFQPEMG